MRQGEILFLQTVARATNSGGAARSASPFFAFLGSSSVNPSDRVVTKEVRNFLGCRTLQLIVLTVCQVEHEKRCIVTDGVIVRHYYLIQTDIAQVPACPIVFEELRH
jgi:hypothetical protein